MMFLILTTGHPWKEIEEEWDIPRVERWLAYCQNHPPLGLGNFQMYKFHRRQNHHWLQCHK